MTFPVNENYPRLIHLPAKHIPNVSLDLRIQTGSWGPGGQGCYEAMPGSSRRAARKVPYRGTSDCLDVQSLSEPEGALHTAQHCRRGSTAPGGYRLPSSAGTSSGKLIAIQIQQAEAGQSLAIHAGMAPLILLCPRSITSSRVSLLNSGRELARSSPVRLRASNSLRCVRFPNSEGMPPLILFAPRYNLSRLTRLPSSTGISPNNRFQLRFSISRLVRLPSQAGISRSTGCP